jgi:hypothetical protein
MNDMEENRKETESRSERNAEGWAAAMSRTVNYLSPVWGMLRWSNFATVVGLGVGIRDRVGAHRDRGTVGGRRVGPPGGNTPRSGGQDDRRDLRARPGELMAESTPAPPRPSISDRCWCRLRLCLRCYVHRGPSSWWLFVGCEEIYVVARLAILAIATWMATFGRYWLYFAIVVTLLFAVDILLFNTAVVFVTRRPGNILRSVVLTMIGYLSLAIAFVPAWIAFRCCSGRPWEQIVSALSLSAGALTTAGVEQPVSTGEKLFGIFETFVGIYFLAIIVAGYVSWMKGER